MTDQQSRYLEIVELTLRATDGDLDAAGYARLESLLSGDAEARADYAELVLTLSALDWDAGSETHVARAADQAVRQVILSDVMDEALAERRKHEIEADAQSQLLADLKAQKRESELERRRAALQSKEGDRPTKVIIIPKLVAVLGVAAMVGLVVWIGVVASQPAPTQPTAGNTDPETNMQTQTPPANVAIVRSSVDAQWTGREAGHEYLRSDAAVTLTEGYAEVVFGNGAAVIVQGPATFEPTGPNAMSLIAGSITATCPESAAGFTVATANGLITDYGTEFGVNISPDGQMRAQAFSGRIGLTPVGGDEEIDLVAGDAVVADTRGRVRPVELDALAFVREEEFESRCDANDSDYARWVAYSYDLRRDPAVVAYYVFDRSDAEQDVLANHAPNGEGSDGQLGNGDEIVAPQWVDGRFAQTNALRFGDAGGGRTYGVVVPDSNALDLDREMTFALWVRATDPSEFYGTLLSKREVPPWRMNYQVSIMPGMTLQMGTGQDDASRSGFHYSPANERLTEPGWHHLVITSDRQTVRYYLDSEIFDAQTQNLPPEINNAALLIGTSAVGGGTAFFDQAIPFHGDISEVLIAKRAFTETEIQALYDNSRATP